MSTYHYTEARKLIRSDEVNFETCTGERSGCTRQVEALREETERASSGMVFHWVAPQEQTALTEVGALKLITICHESKIGAKLLPPTCIASVIV